MQLSWKVDRHQKVPSLLFLQQFTMLMRRCSPTIRGRGTKLAFCQSKCKTKGKTSSGGRQVELPTRPASQEASREEGSGTNMSKLESSKTDFLKRFVELIFRSLSLKSMLFSVAKIAMERILLATDWLGQ